MVQIKLARADSVDWYVFTISVIMWQLLLRQGGEVLTNHRIDEYESYANLIHINLF